MNQTQVLQKMTGEQRLEQALKLSDFVKELAVINIKEQLGVKATKKNIREELMSRLWGINIKDSRWSRI